MLTFLVKTIVISLSGVLAPGPVTTATLAAGPRNRHAGALIALGHGVVELPLIAAILIGLGPVFENARVRIGIGLAGGFFLLLMAAQMLRSLQPSKRPPDETPRTKGPLATGVVLTATNPYFLLWWATVGLALATQAAGLGILGFALFALVHWSCDLIWLEALCLASHQGTRLLGRRSERVVLAVCAAAMAFFGVRFCWLAWTSR